MSRYQTRLQREYVAMQRNPPPYISAAPLPENILEWHYVLHDLPEQPYAGGYYHGKVWWWCWWWGHE
jgi:ubiquitin-conjugating enzyme E2 J2